MTSPTQPPVHVGPLAVLAFVAEIAMLVGLAIVGWHLSDTGALSLALALVLPAAAGVVWWLWCAPRAPHRLPTGARWLVKVTLASATFALLVVVVSGTVAAALGLGTWLAFLVSLPADRSP